jgi:SPP1 family predicted phage head-tail adaptor
MALGTLAVARDGLEIGRLRHRVSIQARTEVSDGHDGYTETWATTRSRWAAMVEPLIGRDLERARQVDPRISHRVTFRYWRAYRDDLDGGRVRVVYHPTSLSSDDRTFEVISAPVDVGEAHVAVQVECKELA